MALSRYAGAGKDDNPMEWEVSNGVLRGDIVGMQPKVGIPSGKLT